MKNRVVRENFYDHYACYRYNSQVNFIDVVTLGLQNMSADIKRNGAECTWDEEND